LRPDPASLAKKTGYFQIMQVQVVKSKIHKARITECELDYEGSLGIDLDLLDAVGMLPYEKILVVNATNGERLETYAIPAPHGSKTVCLNGAAARRGAVGDVVTIMSFGICDQEEAAEHKPAVIVLDENNDIVRQRG
jgi:aspartate 1-decarboxylase